MAGEYVQVRMADGVYVPFEVDADYDGPVRAGRLDDALDRAGETLEAGIERAKEIVKSVGARISALQSPAPAKVAVEIGLKMSASAGVVVAKAATEAHIKITVEWQRDPAEPAPADDESPSAETQSSEKDR